MITSVLAYVNVSYFLRFRSCIRENLFQVSFPAKAGVYIQYLYSIFSFLKIRKCIFSYHLSWETFIKKLFMRHNSASDLSAKLGMTTRVALSKNYKESSLMQIY